MPPSPLTQLQVSPSVEVLPSSAIAFSPVTPGSDFIDLHTNVLHYKGMTINLDQASARQFRTLAAAICITKLKAELEEPDAQ
jgi:hypothetical protein